MLWKLDVLSNYTVHMHSKYAQSVNSSVSVQDS